MRTRRIEVIKPITGAKTANQINFCCSREVGVPKITKIDLKFAKILRSTNNQEFFLEKLLSNALCCPLKALDGFI